MPINYHPYNESSTKRKGDIVPKYFIRYNSDIL